MRTALLFPLLAGTLGVFLGCTPPPKTAISPECKFLYTSHQNSGGRWRADTLYRCGNDVVVRRDDNSLPNRAATIAAGVPAQR